MDNRHIEHLIYCLRQRDDSDRSNIAPAVLLNNAIYYIPRVQSTQLLGPLINALIEWDQLQFMQLFDIYEVTKDIFSLKLQISEPTISLKDFYSLWDTILRACKAWTPPKFALLCGVLSTKQAFILLQSNFFIDSSGTVIKYYEQWKQELFSPLWTSFVTKYHNLKKEATEFVVLYCTVNDVDDIHYLKSDQREVIALLLTDLLRDIIISKDRKIDEGKLLYVNRNISLFARTLQSAVKATSFRTRQYCLSVFCALSYDISAKEIYNGPRTKDYSQREYSDILLTFVLAMKAVLESDPTFPAEWCQQIIISLFNLNFIAVDFGITGFDSYEYLYESTFFGLLGSSESASVSRNTIAVMESNIHMPPLESNKINDGKILFFLKFIQKTVFYSKWMLPEEITRIITIAERELLNSSTDSISKEALIFLSMLLKKPSSSSKWILWQTTHWQEIYIIFLEEFLTNKINKDLLLALMDNICSNLKELRRVCKYNIEDTLTYTTSQLRSRRSLTSNQKAILIKCSIILIPYTSMNQTVWLKEAWKLSKDSKIDTKQRKEVVDSIWNILPALQNDDAIKWWYLQNQTLSSKL